MTEKTEADNMGHVCETDEYVQMYMKGKQETNAQWHSKIRQVVKELKISGDNGYGDNMFWEAIEKLEELIK